MKYIFRVFIFLILLYIASPYISKVFDGIGATKNLNNTVENIREDISTKIKDVLGDTGLDDIQEFDDVEINIVE